MALANFSMAYQPVTAMPFFYPGNHAVNSLRLNGVLAASSVPEYDEDESLRYSAYAVQYQQQRQQQRQNNQYSAPSSYSYAPQNSQGLATNYQQAQNQRIKTRDNDSKTVQLSSGPLQTNVPSREEQPPPLEQQQHTLQDNYPGRPTGYTKVNTGFAGSGAKTSLHAILDYDDDEENADDYYDDDAKVPFDTNVTPIQGPIFLKDGKVPVVPLYSYPRTNNGSLVQIPLLWTALSVALGVELKGDIVKGIPCIKKNHQLYCPTAGNSYPIERIENFIDENKALIKRMYGEFDMGSDQDALTRRRRKATRHDIPDGGPKNPLTGHHVGESFFSHLRSKRQDTKNFNTNAETGRMDVCESKIEIITPYWSRNSAGKLRAVVNTQHFEQAIHQEVCTKPRTGRCSNDCGCEQKYKWHRLLAYDPDNDCKGIFMDWFLFPSCCVCRCDPDKKSEKSDEN